MWNYNHSQTPHSNPIAPATAKISSATETASKIINKWAALAELSLIPGVGTKNCGLLLHAGVGSTGQLAQMPSERLHRQLLRLHVAMLGQNSLCPTVAEVTQWVIQARRLAHR